MKRIGLGLGSLVLAAASIAIGCDADVPIDNPEENPAILAPRGVIRGTVSYFGPPPCFRNGEVEGQVVLLLFDAANPPPPDGLASTALNFATVPGTKLFPNAAPPTSGPGSKGNSASFCPSIDDTPIVAATDWSMQQVVAGRYQVRSFYSRQSRWNPLFNFANLALAGDVAGGALVDVRAAIPRFATVEVGIPDRNGKLAMPDSGFIRDGVSVALGLPLRSNRPYFHVELGKSTGFDVPPRIDRDFASNGTAMTPAELQAVYAGQRKPLSGAELQAKGFITFPQDHLSTSQTKTFDMALGAVCTGNPDPRCDMFEFAQASFPQIRFKYGFAGDDANNIGDPAGADSWIAKNAIPKQGFSDRRRKFYGIDPKEFVADIPSSGAFTLTRVFDSKGQPEIIRDNDTLESVAEIAEIFPSVVLSKLVDDGEGNLAMPPRSQTDPVVVIQTMTLADWAPGKGPAGVGSMKATSESAVISGGLTNSTTITTTIACDAATNPCPAGQGYTCNATSKTCEIPPNSTLDPSNPLAKRDGVVLQDGFTALVRPSVVCIYPQEDLRGTLVTPVQRDPNPANGDAELVKPSKIKELRANRVKNVAFGCLPPGYYSINVVYPTGQAWSFPNLSGHCSYTARFAPNEDCYMPNRNVAAGGFDWLNPRVAIRGFDPNQGFPLTGDKMFRPLLRSQSPFQYEDDGRLKVVPANAPASPLPGYPVPTAMVTLPQVVVITPSARCGRWEAESALSCANDAACPAPFKGACISGKCDVNGDGKISTKPIWVNNPENEDIVLGADHEASDKAANGKLDDGEDTNMNGKLDMHAPFVCSLPRDKWATLPQALSAK